MKSRVLELSRQSSIVIGYWLEVMTRAEKYLIGIIFFMLYLYNTSSKALKKRKDGLLVAP
jgi:hypothetical protein